jgi:hypothetical protein
VTRVSDFDGQEELVGCDQSPFAAFRLQNRHIRADHRVVAQINGDLGEHSPFREHRQEFRDDAHLLRAVPASGWRHPLQLSLDQFDPHVLECASLDHPLKISGGEAHPHRGGET